ncbi:MAG TPA: ATP-binding protein [Thermomicrobiales bacterium]|nr:ATP-binding protein [Thermomicrobiales bacterium]
MDIGSSAAKPDRDPSPGQIPAEGTYPWRNPLYQPGSRRAHGLRFSIAAPFAALTLVVLLILAIVLGNYARSVYMDRLEDALATQAQLVAVDYEQVAATNPPQGAIQTLVNARAQTTGNRITIIDADGRVLADSEADAATMVNHNQRPEVEEARSAGRGEDERTSATIDSGFMYVAVLTNANDGVVVRVAVDLDQVTEVVDRIRATFLVAAVAAAAVVAFLSIQIANRIARSIDGLERQLEAFAEGQLNARVVPSGPREVMELGWSYNRMADELQTSIVAIEQTRNRLQAVMASLEDGVILTDEDGVVLKLNRAAEHLLQATGVQALGRPFPQVVRDHEIAEQLDHTLEEHGREVSTVEHGVDRRTLLVTTQMAEGRQERLGLVVLRDVTRLRQLEQVRREFVANVSHELRTPLTSIRALAETLEAGALEEPEMAGQFVERILVEVDRLTALVEDLLDMARLEAGRSPLNLEVHDLGEVVEHAADRLRAQVDRAKLAMQVEIGDDLEPIALDRVRIEQVLLNLVHNAIKFTPPGGTITIGVERGDGVLVTRVTDTGVGIPEAEQERLFERFYKSDKARNSGGTGLGLAIAKNIVLAHGGEISVESRPDEGATFRFTLPLTRKSGQKKRRSMREAVVQRQLRARIGVDE